MDDIAFFDSSSYTNRGGIWPEAGRRERPNASDVSNVPSATSDDVSTVSAPPDLDSSSVTSTSGNLDPNLKPPNSEGNISVRVDAGSEPTSPLPSYPRSTTLPLSRGASPTPEPSHQDLLNPHEHGTPIEDLDSLTEAAQLEVQQPRLRHKASSSSEKSKNRFLGLRRTSLSPSPGLGSRSSSRSPSPAPSLENLRTPSPEPLSRTSTHSDVRPTKSPTPSGQPSLLSTLKSRAGDRQALSNTARETVRKWTVNWGGLKKDRDSGPTSSEDSQDSRPRSASQKVKSSFAEIRAAVDERRERERRNSDVSSTPIPIPDRRGHKERADSVSSTHGPQGEPSSASSSSPRWFAETSPESSSTRPPVIDIDGTQPDSEGVNGIGPPPITIPSPPTPLPPPPIQSQPSQGKTMTIPGIHARHRGEVMSMGYVPPDPPAPEAKSPVSSVYRLWKHSPTTQSEHIDGGMERTSSRPSPVLSVDGAETSPEPSPTDTVTPRTHAPPLPPRTPHMLHSVPGDSSSISPASEALKSIVSRDGGPREKGGEGVEASASDPPAPVSPKPPLPPRKIQASA